MVGTSILFFLVAKRVLDERHPPVKSLLKIEPQSQLNGKKFWLYLLKEVISAF
jgi:hypothetical protein